MSYNTKFDTETILHTLIVFIFRNILSGRAIEKSQANLYVSPSVQFTNSFCWICLRSGYTLQQSVKSVFSQKDTRSDPCP